MNDQPIHEPDDELEQTLAALRETEIPAGPDSAFDRQLVDRLNTASRPTPAPSPNDHERTFPMRRTLSLAASFLLFAAVIGWLVAIDRSPSGSAFAAMLEKVTTARTAKFVLRISLGDEKKMMVAKTTLMEPGWMRQEITGNDADVVQIMNMRQGKMLMLSAKQKQAQMTSMEGLPDKSQSANIIDDFRTFEASKAELIGREELDGRPVLKYRYKKPEGHYLLWLDPEDKLPVKMSMSASASEQDDYGTIVMTDFEWNVPVDESQFSFEIPEGYQFDMHKLDMANTTSKEFTTMLRIYVRLNDHQFPDELNAMKIAMMGKLFNKEGLTGDEKMPHVRERLAYAYERPELAQMTDEEHKRRALELGMPIARGAIFLAQTMEANEWHYLGQGVKLGEADKVVAWWTPKRADGTTDEDTRSATVLYGDLRIETKPVAGLPAAK